MTSESEIENMTLHQLRVNCIDPQSFILINQAISEKKGTLKNLILEYRLDDKAIPV